MKKDVVYQTEIQGFFSRMVSHVKSLFGVQYFKLVDKDAETDDIIDEFVVVQNNNYPGLLNILEEYVGIASCDDLGIEFLQAVSNSEMRKVTQLLERGVDPNFADELGNTAILEAARAGDHEMFKLLMSYGVNFNAKTKDGSTVVTYLRENQNTEIRGLLNMQGYSVNQTIERRCILGNEGLLDFVLIPRTEDEIHPTHGM